VQYSQTLEEAQAQPLPRIKEEGEVFVPNTNAAIIIEPRNIDNFPFNFTNEMQLKLSDNF